MTTQQQQRNKGVRLPSGNIHAATAKMLRRMLVMQADAAAQTLCTQQALMPSTEHKQRPQASATYPESMACDNHLAS